MTNREIQDLWGLFECAHGHFGDSLAHLLLKISMQSALLDGVLLSLAAPQANGSPAVKIRPADLDINQNIERWWSSIGISRRYADPPLAFYCFEKALETVQQKGLQLINTSDADESSTR